MNARHEPSPQQRWSERNQRWLTEALAALCERLDSGGATAPTEPEAAPGFEPALDRCAALFGLSPFERELLLLTAGVELDERLRQAVARAHGRMNAGSRQAQPTFAPTFALALAALAQPHWDALSPQAPLRRWRLVELEGRRTPALQALHVDERVLHFLMGVAAVDERLLGLPRLVEPAASQDAGLAQRIAQALISPGDGRAPLVVLTQERPDAEALGAAARGVLAALDCPALWLQARDLPADAAALAETALLLDREAALAGAMLVVELDGLGEHAPEHEQRCLALLSHLLRPALLLGAVEPARLARLSTRRSVRFAISEAPAFSSDPALARALRQFRLPAGALRGVAEQLASDSAAERPARAWQLCREAARGGLDTLAQRVDSQARFEDLVLPPAPAQLLREIAEHLNHRETVYEEWGLGGRSTRGRGLCVLFAGESGTGKTLAAEVIANEARLDLYRIDLATVVSKYIGETEKNLRRLFDAAEASGAVLLFDEADALFGKRSDVKDSHDRYANIEVAYLLQRVEAYRGLAILTSNFRSALDRAFLRRLRFVVQFPFPDEAARERLWRHELPATAPTRDLDFAALARLQLSGGNIRSVALNAAFMAAGDGGSITMAHLRRAAQRESAKLERSLADVGRQVFS